MKDALDIPLRFSSTHVFLKILLKYKVITFTLLLTAFRNQFANLLFLYKLFVALSKE